MRRCGARRRAAPHDPRTTHPLKLEALLKDGLRSTDELTRLLGVDQHSVRRDLEALANLCHTLEKRGRRCHLVPTSTALNPVEGLAAHSATRLLVHDTRVSERYYRSALTKLSAGLPQPAPRYLEASVADVETLSSEMSRTLEIVALAWFEDRLLAYDYTTPIGSGAQHRTVLEVHYFEISPMNLVPYMMGYERSCFREQRTHSLDRLDHARLLDERCPVADDFDARVALANAWSIVAGAPLKVRVRVRAQAVPHVVSRRDGKLPIEGANEQGDVTVTITSG